MTCTDDGTYTVRLSADDGVNDPVSATATVTVENAPPVLTLDDPAPWAVYRAGTQVDLAASFTDSGANDTHTCKVTWDDGAQESYAPISGSCDRPHTFEHPGMYTIDVTVTDDDGASDNAEVMVVVYDPDAGFVTAGSTIQSPAGALSEDPAHTGKGSFQFNPKYKPHDDGPVPGGGKVSFGLAGSDLDLDATGLEWLVVTPDGKAAVKGTAKVGGRQRVRVRPVRLRRSGQTAHGRLAVVRRPRAGEQPGLRQQPGHLLRPGPGGTAGDHLGQRPGPPLIHRARTGKPVRAPQLVAIQESIGERPGGPRRQAPLGAQRCRLPRHQPAHRAARLPTTATRAWASCAGAARRSSPAQPTRSGRGSWQRPRSTCGPPCRSVPPTRTCQNPQSSTRLAAGQPHSAHARFEPCRPSQPRQHPPNRSGMKTVPRTSPGAIPILSGGVR
ncbi:hypothetical protein GCM10020001_087700 [Nonomuraea salmonea]